MQFEAPLISGYLIKRYKRFLADIQLDNGEIITAHCANSGSMMGLKDEGIKVYVSPANNPKRKLQYTWELVEVNGNLVGVNTSLPNQIVSEAISNGKIEPLCGYESLKREVKYGQNSRIDILLSSSQKPDCFVEVKSVTLCRKPHLGEFPDAITTRGTKHLAELTNQLNIGTRSVMIYLIQYENIKEFSIASDIDKAYNAAFKQALNAGVEAYAYGCKLSPYGIELQKPIPIVYP
ncbi:MAG: DNA/RNA nuclease SfsA [Alphaproteobacteria bacterium]